MKQILDSIAKIVNFVFPNKCFVCQLEVLELGLCEKCFKNINFVNRPYCNVCGKSIFATVPDDVVCIKCSSQSDNFDKMRFLFKFDDLSKKLIHGLKYLDKTNVSYFASKLMYIRYSREILEYDFIIPVPMHKIKRMLRFYNQAEVLAKSIALISNKPILNNILYKSKWTKPQTRLTKKMRAKNVRNSFSTKNTELIYQKKIILVDDVVTTGSTIKNCCELLKDHGAKSVMVLAIAHT